jgi:hypothetical protein
MRIAIDIDEFSLIKMALNDYLDKDIFKNEVEDLLLKLDNELRKPIKPTKRNATKKATYVKMDDAKDKIRNAVNLMNLENKKITINMVAKVSGCSYNTVKKYSYLLAVDF